MQKFLHDQNLARFIDLLESEADPPKRTQLQKLLIEEEDRFGSLSERVDQVEALIVQGGARLRQQKALVARLDGDGIVRGEKVLANMNQILEVMAQYRLTLIDGLDRIGL